MKYISAEEFLKQPKEIQEVFMDWWKPEIGDLYSSFRFKMLDVLECEAKAKGIIANPKVKSNIFPLLTEGQLREFIEDKLKNKIDIEVTVNVDTGKKDYSIYEYDEVDSNYGFLGTNLLQAYWQVALQIAREEVNK